MKNWIIIALVAVIAIGGAIGAFAASQTVNQTFEIRVWEKADDPSANYISARPAGGDWKTLGTIPIKLDSMSASGKYRYGDIELDVAVEVDVCDPATGPCEPVEGQPTATPTPTPTPSGDAGNWIVTRSTDSFDGSTRSFAWLAGIWSPSREFPYDDDIPSLAVRCDSDSGLDIYISVGGYLAGNVGTDTIKVEYRFGDGNIRTGYWNESTDNSAAFVASRELSGFIAGWRSTPSGLFRARIYQFSGGVFGTALFDTSGMASAVNPILQECGY